MSKSSADPAKPVIQVEAREYQQRLVKKTLDAFRAGHSSVLIESPTGAGKTVIAHLIVQALLQTGEISSYGWTCMRRSLIGQASAANDHLFGLQNGRYFCLFSPPSEMKQVDLLIEDECQHAASCTSVNLVQELQPKFHIGLTATPFRSDAMKLSFSKCFRDAGLRDLVDAGYLSPYRLFRWHLEWSPAKLAELYLGERKRWGKSVMYLHRVEQCRAVEALLKAGGVLCETVTGQDGKSQEAVLEAFCAGKIDVLCNVQVLTEGFDCPDLQTVFLHKAGKGPTIQMAGRVFRKHPSLPCKQIVQQTTGSPIEQVVSPEDLLDWKDGAWVSCHVNERRLEEIRQKVVHILSQLPNPSLPPYLKQRRTRFFGERRA